MVLRSLENCWGGALLVPQIPSYRITDLAMAIGPECEYPVIGVRPGEKIHEEMITASDSFNTVDLGPYYAILPTGASYTSAEYCARINAKPVKPEFSYDSGSNEHFLSVEELRNLISTHVEPSFGAKS